MRKRRIFILVCAGLAVTLGLVQWMNLQTPVILAHSSDMPSNTTLRTYPGEARNPGAPDSASAGSSENSSAASSISLPAAPNARRDTKGNPEQAADSPVSDADLGYLSSSHLLIPVLGVKPSQLKDTFWDARSGGRQHNAIDIMAPKDSSVVAAADGTIARLFNSRLGGTTLYEFDKSGRFVLYYAHLAAYANGITEGKAVHKGDLLAYVGDTGDAGPGNYHLHFAISKLTTPWRWYGGDAIDPYPLLGGK